MLLRAKRTSQPSPPRAPKRVGVTMAATHQGVCSNGLSSLWLWARRPFHIARNTHRRCPYASVEVYHGLRWVGVREVVETSPHDRVGLREIVPKAQDVPHLMRDKPAAHPVVHDGLWDTLC